MGPLLQSSRGNTKLKIVKFSRNKLPLQKKTLRAAFQWNMYTYYVHV